jgi:TolB-like protein/Tfp pilus assembly protein PilF
LAQSPSEEPPAAGSRADRGTADAPSIAVLPFVNMSAEPDNEPFADGLSEEVLNVLAGIQGLKVAGRTSSFYFKGRNEPASVMAAVLKVSHLLEGSVRKAGERVRITAQLVDAQSGYHLWSQTFDRELNDVFAVQEDIARAVASALKVQLLPEDDAHLAKRGTADAEAYRLYLLGRGRMRERSIGGLRAARTLFEQAIARDPNFAAAYAGLSDSYHLLMNNHREEMQDGEKQGTRAAARAIELDPHSSEAYASRANFERQRYQATGELSAKLAALADYRRAVELDPTNAQAYHWLGIALNDDDQAGAMEAYEKAVELDPLLRQAQLALAEALADQGRHEEAFDRVDEVVERFPDFANAYLQAAGLHGRLGHLGDALELTTRAYDLSAEFRIAIGAYALSVDLGDLEQAARWLERAGTNSVGAVARELARLGYQRDYAAQLPLLEQGAELGLYHETRLSIAVVRLILSRPEQAAQTIADGFAALVAGEDSINVLNCDAAIALTAAWQRTGRQADARRLLERTAAWFDGPSVPRYGDRWVARAAIHALLGERDQAFRALDRAFDEGYRGTWGFALGVVAPLIRGEDNPVFDNIRDDPRFSAWFERIRADNARQLAQWKARSGDATARSAGL